MAASRRTSATASSATCRDDGQDGLVMEKVLWSLTAVRSPSASSEPAGSSGSQQRQASFPGSAEGNDELVPGSQLKGTYGVWRYGWLVTRMYGHRFEGQHAHGEPGWSSWFVRFPDDQLTVVLFQNRTQALEAWRMRSSHVSSAVHAALRRRQNPAEAKRFFGAALAARGRR
jgi:CubicO group peptidase (beta-lactamase class C family)